MQPLPATVGGSASNSPVLQVLVVQGHPLLGSAIAGIVGHESDMCLCGIARTGHEAAEVAVRSKADVVLIDFELPDMSGPAAAAAIRTRIPDATIVIHSAEDSETALMDAIAAGATAFLTRSATAGQIVEAIRRAGRGDSLIPASLFAKAIARHRAALDEQRKRHQVTAQFTPRELDVLKLLGEGLDTVVISRNLGVTVNTVEWHTRHLIEKLGVHSKLQVVVAAARLGLIELSKP
jgi:DNA-binding NarL/FixJ family response regulator